VYPPTANNRQLDGGCGGGDRSEREVGQCRP